MSNRLCNYCLYKKIEQNAGKEKIVTAREADFEAIKEFNKGSPGVDILVDGKFVVWFMELPKECVC